jgi:outer membrane receptor protein involved in Fe transport
MRYLDAYYVYTDNASVTARANAILSQGSPVIPSQSYHDVSGRYSFGETNELGGGILKNTELRLAVQNVFNTAPHTLAGTVATGLGGLYARGGNPFLRQYSISIKKGF